MDPACRLALGLVVFAACTDNDPLDSATNNTTVSAGPTSNQTGGSSNQTAPSSDPGTSGEPTGADTDSSGMVTDSTSSTSGPTSSSGTTGPVPTYTADIQPIWDAHCVAACHEAGGVGATWLVLTDDSAYTTLVGAKSLSFNSLTLVVPGDLDNSYLWNKLHNTQADVGGGTSPMPQPPEEPLGAAELDVIAAWIGGDAPL